MKPRRLPLAWRSLPFFAAALYIAILGTPWENTFTLAAHGQIDLPTVFFYRFREGDLLAGFGWASPAVDAFLAAIKLIGSRALWIVICLATGALCTRRSLLIITAQVCLVVTGALLGEAFLLWSLLAAILAQTLVQLKHLRASRHSEPKAKLVFSLHIAGLALITPLIFALANPMHALQRHRVLGGRSITDRLHLFSGRTAFPIEANCAAVLNPDDLHGVNAVEIMDRASLRRLTKTSLLDLKLVERNYQLLYLKNEGGQYIFSDAARNFAKVEAAYATNALQSALTEPRLCLVAAFDTRPEQEEPPFSRARIILDVRKKAGKDTQVIQLPRL